MLAAEFNNEPQTDRLDRWIARVITVGYNPFAGRIFSDQLRLTLEGTYSIHG